MSKITYLIGAGASYGKRSDNFFHGVITKNKNETSSSGSFNCANIIEGLPIVNEIPDRISFIIKKVWEDLNKLNLNAQESLVYEHFAEDLEWMQKESKQHQTIDTFAKKLWITKHQEEYKTLKRTLSLYLTLEQLYNKPDKRYDSFFASILGNDVFSLPDISIVSWNYDCQFEIAYHNYLNRTFNEISMVLNSYHKGTLPLLLYPKQPKFKLTKLNGSALVYDTQNNEFSNTIFKPDINREIYFAVKPYFSDNVNLVNNLSFAWEKMNMDTDTDFFDTLKNRISETEILVVIGYSFPYFNREIDRILLTNMPRLHKIYIQDPNADSIEESVENLFINIRNPKETPQINKITNTAQFYLPPEL